MVQEASESGRIYYPRSAHSLRKFRVKTLAHREGALFSGGRFPLSGRGSGLKVSQGLSFTAPDACRLDEKSARQVPRAIAIRSFGLL
jgi:hypothetical protein